MLFGNEPARQTFKVSHKYKIYPGEEGSVITIVRLDSMKTSIIDSFKKMISGYHFQQSALNDGNIQFENKEKAGQLDVLETTDAAINQNARCLSLEGVRLPMESARRFKPVLPLACEQHILSNIDISVQQIPINGRYCLKEELSL